MVVSVTGRASAHKARAVILISIDALRADHLGCYGYRLPTSPFLDRLAAQGVRFRHAYCPSPITLASHHGMFTGLYPAYNTACVYNELRVDLEADRTVAQRLSEAGVATAAFVSGLPLTEPFTDGFGFEHFDQELDRPVATRPGEVRRLGADTLAAFLRWLEQQPAGQPFFAFIHLFDTHSPLDIPDPLVRSFDESVTAGQSLPLVETHFPGGIPEYALLQDPPGGAHTGDAYRARYDGAVRYLDSVLQGIAEALRERGRDQVVWIVTSDHGEALGENGYWCSHSHAATLEQIQVPLLMAGLPPALRQALLSEQTVVSLLDLCPSILDIFGVEYAANDFQGQSLFRFSGEPLRRPCVFSHGATQVAAADERCSLVAGLPTLGWEPVSFRLYLNVREAQAVAGDSAVSGGAHLNGPLEEFVRDAYAHDPLVRRRPAEAATLEEEQEICRRLAGLGYVSEGRGPEGTAAESACLHLPPLDLRPAEAAREQQITLLYLRKTALIRDLAKHAENLERLVANREEQIAGLRAHGAGLEAQIAVLHGDITALQAHVAALQAHIGALGAHIAALEAQAAAFRAQAAFFQQRYETVIGKPPLSWLLAVKRRLLPRR